jgi:hypothetical protein
MRTGTGCVQFGCSGKQLRDFAVRKRPRAAPCWTALYHTSRRDPPWSLHPWRKSIRDADKGYVRPLPSLFLNPPCNSRLVRTRFTRDQVPVSSKLYLKWQLEEPLKLATHGYEMPYDALGTRPNPF